MLVKCLEFKNAVGRKVVIKEIPVLELKHPHFFLIQIRLQSFVDSICDDRRECDSYSFREYLKKTVKWPVYDELFGSSKLKNNA